MLKGVAKQGMETHDGGGSDGGADSGTEGGGDAAVDGAAETTRVVADEHAECEFELEELKLDEAMESIQMVISLLLPAVPVVARIAVSRMGCGITSVSWCSEAMKRRSPVNLSKRGSCSLFSGAWASRFFSRRPISCF